VRRSRPTLTRGFLALGLVPFVFTGTVGCDSCENADCGSGVSVVWRAADLPAASRYRLCIDTVCERVRPYSSRDADGARILRVAPSSGTGAKDVRVRFELFDAAGSVIDSFEGEGRKTGECCPFVAFRATSSGALVVGES
jgi:hypothetical protein